jgi:hypothetical protein
VVDLYAPFVDNAEIFHFAPGGRPDIAIVPSLASSAGSPAAQPQPKSASTRHALYGARQEKRNGEAAAANTAYRARNP